MSGGGGERNNNALETISAAASAIASSDDRLHQATTAPKRRWWSRWSISLCFGSSKQRKRIGHSVLVPEPVAPTINSPAPGYPARPSVIALPFVAPPSSPVSFLQSEPPSATQSPVGLVSFSPIPGNIYYSPGNRPSIFAIGPYAHETQLVSPPVFSTYTTEPSTAPITPPPESIHLTTPSSPEVPFAQLFNPGLQTGDYGQRLMMSNNYEFQFYQLPPGSPLGQLISPSSAVSGSGPASPFTDGETAIGNPRFPQFPISEPPKLLSPGNLSTLQVPKTTKLYYHQPHQQQQQQQPSLSSAGPRDPRVSIDRGAPRDRSAEHVIRCVEQKLRTTFPEASENPSEEEAAAAEATDRREQIHHQSVSLGSVKEFDFGTDEKEVRRITEEDRVPKNNNNWSFFPVMHPPSTTIS